MGCHHWAKAAQMESSEFHLSAEATGLHMPQGPHGRSKKDQTDQGSRDTALCPSSTCHFLWVADDPIVNSFARNTGKTDAV